MYSKMQKRDCCALKGKCVWTPSLSTTIISPGFTSRTYSAPMMSSAQVSLAKIYAPSSWPITSGRTPLGSRTPISFLEVSATSE